MAKNMENDEIQFGMLIVCLEIWDVYLTVPCHLSPKSFSFLYALKSEVDYLNSLPPGDMDRGLFSA
jgi:hypothetical protein